MRSLLAFGLGLTTGSDVSLAWAWVRGVEAGVVPFEARGDEGVAGAEPGKGAVGGAGLEMENEAVRGDMSLWPLGLCALTEPAAARGKGDVAGDVAGGGSVLNE